MKANVAGGQTVSGEVSSAQLCRSICGSKCGNVTLTAEISKTGAIMLHRVNFCSYVGYVLIVGCLLTIACCLVVALRLGRLCTWCVFTGLYVTFKML